MKNQIKRVTSVILAAVMVLLLVQVSVFAEITIDPPVVNYEEGTITITGDLNYDESGMRVTYTITDEEGNVVYMNQGFAGTNGAFSDVSMISTLYGTGTYTLSVMASEYDAPVTTTFEVDFSQEVVSASDAAITGMENNLIEEGDELTGTYTFFSGFGQEEGDSRYTWSIGASAEGPFNHVIEGATDKDYTFSTADIVDIVEDNAAEFADKQFFLQFSVEPKAVTSVDYAEKVSSPAVEINVAPFALDVEIKGTAKVGKKLTGDYEYNDLAGRDEANSEYRWLASSRADGTYREIATGITYIPKNSDEGKYLKFEVTPIAEDGSVGSPVLSDSVKISGDSGGGGSVSVGVSGPTNNEPIVPNPPDSIPGEFEDVADDHWAKSIIKEVVLRGDANGVSETEFEPERPITRAEFAQLIVNTLDLKEKNYVGSFSDVAATSWYASAVQTVADAGLMEGFENSFRPDALITREEMAKVVYEAYLYADGEKVEGAEAAFSDRDTVSDWAVEAIAQASALELINGMPDGTFAPKAQATRAEAVTIINRLYHLLNA